MSTHHASAREAQAATPDREPGTDGAAASAATAPEQEGHTALTTATATPSTGRPPDGQTNQQATWRIDRPGRERAPSARELVALAERHEAARNQNGLDAVRAEAERRAHDQAPDGLAARIAGYIGLLAEDTEHTLADEAHAWSRELHRALDPVGPSSSAMPAPRRHTDGSVRS